MEIDPIRKRVNKSDDNMVVPTDEVVPSEVRDTYGNDPFSPLAKGNPTLPVEIESSVDLYQD